ncbi:DUF3667 domain-containing protein [Gillisia limnaea]|uniref:DUF3667 domain-containing protein n=1 Tax=Gillisia limnaea (strain DSM 15749 / LMG 21470 / R-8282) TaxID=865937 RepID=H2BX33_GILLR|nr:DUF3667 domain-containing protein [Gillisia limnaea]EHQ01985.1 hypothetical protein Gilli_1319 [Gillisia limnaea DSM 15749]
MNNNRSLTKYRGDHCLNCEHPLDISDKFCPNCGQLNSTKKLSFNDFFKEFFAGLFAYDSRIRRTLSTLLFHPGKISKEYIRGKRDYYANPFRFYLSASIIFFIIWSFTSNFEGINAENQVPIEELSEEDTQKLREGIGQIPAVGGQINIDSIITEKRAASKKTYKEYHISQLELDSLTFFNSFPKQFDLYTRFNKETKIITPGIALDSLNHSQSFFNGWVFEKATDWNFFESNPQIFVSYFISKLPFIIFFYLPVFALFIWLLYSWQSFNYMEHLIFAFHVQTSFFVITGIALLLDAIFVTDAFVGFSLLLFLFYLYKALRRFYGQGRFLTFVKFILLNGIFLILALIAAAISLIASFAIF